MNELQLKAFDKAVFEFIIIAGPAVMVYFFTDNSSAAWQVFWLLFIAKWLYNILKNEILK